MVGTRFTVEMGHLRRVVTRSGGEVRRYRRVDAREVGGIEFQGERTKAFIELLAAPRADHRYNVRSTRAHPTQRQLRRRGVFFVSDLPQGLDQFQVPLKIAL